MATKMTAEQKAQRKAWRRQGLCPECGGDTRDGNCSPIYDHIGLCADCGEARYEREHPQG